MSGYNKCDPVRTATPPDKDTTRRQRCTLSIYFIFLLEAGYGERGLELVIESYFKNFAPGRNRICWELSAKHGRSLKSSE